MAFLDQQIGRRQFIKDAAKMAGSLFVPGGRRTDQEAIPNQTGVEYTIAEPGRLLGSPQIAIAEGDKSLAVTYFKGSPSPWNRPLLTIINQSGETVSKEAVLFGDCADTYPYSPDSSTQVIYDKQREKYFAISGAAQGEQGQNKRFLAQWISPDGKQEESFDLRPEARYYPNAISLSDGKILIICTNIVGPYDHRMESFIFDPDKKTTSTSVSLKSSASLAFPKVAMNENGEGVVTMIGWPSWGERPSSGLYYSKIAKDGTIGEPQLLVRKPFNTAQSAVSTSHFDIVTAVNYGAPSYTYYVINRASGEIRMASITPPTSTNERLAFDAPDICVLPGGMLHLSSSVSKTVPNKPGEDRDVWQANMKPGDLSVWDQHFSTKPDRSELFPRASSSNGSIWTVYSGWSNKAFSDSGIYAEKREISPAPQTHNIYLPFIKK